LTIFKAVATNATDFVPPAWSCGVNSEQEFNSTTRHLVEHDHEDNHYHSHHDHSDHDHSHQDHSDHDHSHHDHFDHYFDPSNDDALSHVQHSLRGSEMRFGKRRRVQGGTSSYAYWVDIYIEIDYDLCNRNAELALCNAGTIGPNTINYGMLLLLDYSSLKLLSCILCYISSTHTLMPTYHSEQTTISECIVCGSKYHL
jgi:hypothetical protein